MPHAPRPAPVRSLSDRRDRPFRQQRLRVGPLLDIDQGFQAVYNSPYLDTQGYTLHNAFLSLRVRDIQPPNAQVELQAALVESFGSGAVRLGQQTVVLQGLAPSPGGDIVFPLLQGDTLSIEFGVVILARGTNNPRFTLDINGMLVTGLSIEQRA